MSEESLPQTEFDFDVHAKAAVTQYQAIQTSYEQLAYVAKKVLNVTLIEKGIRFHSIEARAKSLESFEKKAAKPSEGDSNKPKYQNPLLDITDLAGVRVITFLPRTVESVCSHIEEEFKVLEKTDKAAELMDMGKFGYQSIHYLVHMHPHRTCLPEYARQKGVTFEIQVRTLLQHAWAEMEHDIQYKSTAVIPTAIRRRFVALAGILEIADREFQALQDEDERLRLQARASVQEGQLSAVEITPDALKSYLDRRLGPDGRMKQWSYEFTANLLRKLGFETLSQVDACISGFNDDIVSRVLWGSRQGQVSRFEDTLLAAMGEQFISRHPWGRHEYWPRAFRDKLDKLTKAGIPIGKNNPNEY